MFAKILIFLIIWRTKIDVYGEFVQCGFIDAFFENPVLGINDTFYTCNLDTRKLDYSRLATNINGDHVRGKSDNDVKRLSNYENHTIKTISSIFCQRFSNLEVFYFMESLIETIDENAFVKCKNLKYLILFNQNFLELDRNLLSSNAELQSIFIKNSKLASLDELFFRHVRKLKVLILSDAELKVINPEWSDKLDSLLLLALDENKITEVPSKAFMLAEKLTKLFLNNNKINTLLFDSFEGLKNLKALHLNNNNISSLPENVFHPLKMLETLQLSNNALTILQANFFDSHIHLTTIKLENNMIDAIDEKIIENPALENFLMKNNVCSSSNVSKRDSLNQTLTKCFENYQKKLLLLNSRSSNLFSTRSFCGKSKKAQGMVIKGEKIERGAFPWIAALIENDKYFCGGVVISMRKVLTAAHCIQGKENIHSVTANDFLVLLGTHDLDKKLEVGRQIVGVEKVNIHPDWKVYTESFDADIAVLILADDAIFGQFIQPICMIPPNSPIATITSGVVVGYGKSEDETKKHENIPQMLNMKIHKNDECFFHNNLLVPLSSTRTYCAGEGKGQGVCSGDSGSGLFIEYEDTYFLRGLVSSSLYTSTNCDVNSFSVFTNILSFYDWINQQSGNPNLLHKLLLKK